MEKIFFETIQAEYIFLIKDDYLDIQKPPKRYKISMKAIFYESQ
jgi:hypothetical protein